MEWNYREDLPIYSQLVEQLKKAIAAGTLKPGERLMAVRDMAAEAGVNPNTMQKALAELEQQGLVYTQRTAGRFVTEDTERIREVGKSLAQDAIQNFLKHMQELGFSGKDAADLVLTYKNNSIASESSEAAEHK